jgi:hypothetical protein
MHVEQLGVRGPVSEVFHRIKRAMTTQFIHTSTESEVLFSTHHTIGSAGHLFYLLFSLDISCNAFPHIIEQILRTSRKNF